ncbi:preprotein translocase subunit TatA [Candidatus Woesebacteria bacterium RBG_13_34_9]|uniref:Sec-independent protein translocase protein TatA n=1 Tax=Candidatus Woesebacteria bacterium RBG_13_34_9 TaxID=1802477 RepID=A0A1F7X0W9_9BACT|nr:MAG: preprotein translocase subunit TatA [Candidatus Woesebacteria bacterium RBG_13_34_9]
MGSFGLSEILIIALVVMIFFGSKKLPEFIKGLGEALKEFKRGMKEE